MACHHKFYDELELVDLDYAPETLIVGTFNPEWPEENTAQWFYGRTHDAHGFQSNNAWDVLPQLYDEPSLINSGPVEWKAFCRRHLIAITDLIASIEDAEDDNPEHVGWLASYGDKQIAENFHEFDFTPINDILLNHPTIAHIYLTRGAQGFWRHRWAPIRNAALLQGKSAETLLTPSDWARIQRLKHNRRYPQQVFDSLPEFILSKWQAAWHFKSLT